LNFNEWRVGIPRKALFAKKCSIVPLYTYSSIKSLGSLDPALKPKWPLQALSLPEALSRTLSDLTTGRGHYSYPMPSPFKDQPLLGEEYNPKTHILHGISMDYVIF
jgi:hypothetical protein